jgi:hypothetical protein
VKRLAQPQIAVVQHLGFGGPRRRHIVENDDVTDGFMEKFGRPASLVNHLVTTHAMD